MNFPFVYISFVYSYLRNGQKNRWPWKDALWIKRDWRHKKSSRLVSLFLPGHCIQPKTSVYTCDNSPVFRKPTDAMQFADVLEQIYDRHSAVLHLSLLWHDRRFSPYQEAFLLLSSNSKNKPHQKRENSKRSNNWDPFWMSSICLELESVHFLVSSYSSSYFVRTRAGPSFSVGYTTRRIHGHHQ